MYRAENKTENTKEQLRVASWLIELGLLTNLEVSFPPYIADIYLPELDLIIELDGPHHWASKDKKRDTYLNEEHGVNVWRFKNEVIKASFKEDFIALIMKRAEELR